MEVKSKGKCMLVGFNPNIKYSQRNQIKQNTAFGTFVPNWHAAIKKDPNEALNGVIGTAFAFRFEQPNLLEDLKDTLPKVLEDPNIKMSSTLRKGYQKIIDVIIPPKN